MTANFIDSVHMAERYVYNYSAEAVPISNDRDGRVDVERIWWQ